MFGCSGYRDGLTKCMSLSTLNNACLVDLQSCLLLSPLQLVRDMVAVGESTGWAARSSTEARYRSLRCEVTHEDPASPVYQRICKQILESQDE